MISDIDTSLHMITDQRINCRGIENPRCRDRLRSQFLAAQRRGFPLFEPGACLVAHGLSASLNLQAAPAAAGGCMLGDEDRVIPHRGLLAVVRWIGGGETFFDGCRAVGSSPDGQAPSESPQSILGTNQKSA